MANNNWSRWYREGLVSLTAGSRIVTGTDTYWLSASLHVGDLFSVDDVTEYEVAEITDNTHLTLATAYSGSDTSGVHYRIVRNFNATLPAEIAAKTAGLIGDFIKYIDLDMQSIHGKSAYEVAKAAGYIGTESEWLESLSAYGIAKASGYSGTISDWLSSLKGDSAYQVAVSGGYNGTAAEWLESLKAAGEWSTLDARTRVLSEGVGAGYHNSIYRGKNLGSEFTAAQASAIRSGAFTDLYLGDYWQNGDTKYIIAGFNYLWNRLGGTAFYNNHPFGRNSVAIIRLNTSEGTHIDNMYKVWLDDQTLSAYIDSNFYVNRRPVLIEELEGFFGAAHIYSYPEHGYTCDENGEYTGWTEYTAKCELLTAYQMTGKVFTQTNGEPVEPEYNVLNKRIGALPIIKLNPNVILGDSPGSMVLRDLYGANRRSLYFWCTLSVNGWGTFPMVPTIAGIM